MDLLTAKDNTNVRVRRRMPRGAPERREKT